jgi:hypothetical protein
MATARASAGLAGHFSMSYVGNLPWPLFSQAGMS